MMYLTDARLYMCRAQTETVVLHSTTAGGAKEQNMINIFQTVTFKTTLYADYIVIHIEGTSVDEPVSAQL